MGGYNIYTGGTDTSKQAIASNLEFDSIVYIFSHGSRSSLSQRNDFLTGFSCPVNEICLNSAEFYCTGGLATPLTCTPRDLSKMKLAFIGGCSTGEGHLESFDFHEAFIRPGRTDGAKSFVGFTSPKYGMAFDSMFFVYAKEGYNVKESVNKARIYLDHDNNYICGVAVGCAPWEEGASGLLYRKLSMRDIMIVW